MFSIEETLALAKPDAEFVEVSEHLRVFGALNGWDMDTDIIEQREMLAQVREHTPSNPPSCVVEDIKVTVRDGTALPARVYKPRTIPDGGCPGFMIYHGGGYCIGDLELEKWLCDLITNLGAIAVDVQFRLSPEHPFPAPINDSFDGLKWVAQNHEKLGIAPGKGFLVGGESSGADIALAVAHMCRDEKDLPRVTGLYIAMPSALKEAYVPERYKDRFLSVEQNAQALLWNKISIAYVEKLYKPDFSSPLASPVLFDHSGIPKTYFVACGADPLRDCTLILEQIWKDAGIPTRLDIYPGIPHAGWVFFPTSKFAQKHVEDSREGLRWLLSP